MATITQAKEEVRNVLNQLITDGYLREVQEDDYRIPVLSRDFSAFPAAVLTSPAVESEAFTSQENLRTCVFRILIVVNGDDITSAREVEELMEKVLDAFDDDPTLGGISVGMAPSASPPEPVSTQDRRLVMFEVQVRVQLRSAW